MGDQRSAVDIQKKKKKASFQADFLSSPIALPRRTTIPDRRDPTHHEVRRRAVSAEGWGGGDGAERYAQTTFALTGLAACEWSATGWLS